MTHTVKGKTKETPLPFEKCVSIGTTTAYFQVQAAIQDLGYILIDLETGEVIDGQVSLSEVGILDPRKPRPPARRMGFVQPADHQPTNFSGSHVDAILSTQESQPGEPSLIVVDVVDNAEVKLWSQHAHKICQPFAVNVKGTLTPTVVIGVYGLCTPNKQNPLSAKNAIRRRYQKYGFDEPPTILNNYVLPLDYGYDDQDE